MISLQNSINRIFVHFPVPWDKKPHRRSNLTKLPKRAMRVLRAWEGKALKLLRNLE